MPDILVVSIDAAGTATALHNEAFDLGFLGRKHVYRQCLIVFDEDTQTWGVEYIPPGEPGELRYKTPLLGIPSYKEAAELEVAWLNDCRLVGCDPVSSEGIDQATLIMALR